MSKQQVNTILECAISAVSHIGQSTHTIDEGNNVVLDLGMRLVV